MRGKVKNRKLIGKLEENNPKSEDEPKKRKKTFLSRKMSLKNGRLPEKTVEKGWQLCRPERIRPWMPPGKTGDRTDGSSCFFLIFSKNYRIL